MFNTNQQRFYERWLEKAKDHRDNSQTDYSAFDRFISLYIVYNFLYVEVYQYLQEKDKPGITTGNKKGSKENNISSGEKGSATTNITLFFGGAEDFMSEFSPSQRDALEELRSFIKPDDSFKFIIYFDKKGEPQPDKDKKLSKKLKSSGVGQISDAILEMIYEVRCNLFHGRKCIDSVQEDLLNPLSNILEELVQKIYDKLDS